MRCGGEQRTAGLAITAPSSASGSPCPGCRPPRPAFQPNCREFCPLQIQHLFYTLIMASQPGVVRTARRLTNRIAHPTSRPRARSPTGSVRRHDGDTFWAFSDEGDNGDVSEAFSGRGDNGDVSQPFSGKGDNGDVSQRSNDTTNTPDSRDSQNTNHTRRATKEAAQPWGESHCTPRVQRVTLPRPIKKGGAVIAQRRPGSDLSTSRPKFPPQPASVTGRALRP